MTTSISDTGQHSVGQTKDQVATLRKTLEQARLLEGLNRRMERYLVLQLQQLELAIASFEREQAHWNRQYRQELESIEQRKAELAAAEHGTAPKTNSTTKVITDGTTPPLAIGPRSPMFIPLESTGTGPLKIWIQPNGAGPQWLGALLLEISKLNCAAGGEGVRFEMTGCRSPNGKLRRTDDPLCAIYEIEAFSVAPLTGMYGESPATRETLAAWERYRSAMMLGGFDDTDLRKRFEKGQDIGRDHTGWEAFRDAIGRVDDALARLLKTETNAWNRAASLRSEGPEVAFERQLQRLQATRKVMAEECETRSHVSLV